MDAIWVGIVLLCAMPAISIQQVLPGTDPLSDEDRICFGAAMDSSPNFNATCAGVDFDALGNSNFSSLCGNERCVALFDNILSSCSRADFANALRRECSLQLIGLVLTIGQDECLGNILFTGPESAVPRRVFSDSCSRVLNIPELLDRRDLSFACSQQTCLDFFSNAFTICRVDGGQELLNDTCPSFLPGLGFLTRRQEDCLGDQLFEGSESGAGPQFMDSCDETNIEAIIEQRDVAFTCSQQSCVDFFRAAFSTCDIDDGGELLDDRCTPVIPGLNPLTLEQGDCLGSLATSRFAIQSCSRAVLVQIMIERDVSVVCPQKNCTDFFRSIFLACGINDGAELVESECSFSCNGSMKPTALPMLIEVALFCVLMAFKCNY